MAGYVGAPASAELRIPVRRPVRLGQLVVDVAGEGGPRPEVEAGVDVLQVRGDRALTDEQAPGDLGVAQSGRDEPRDLLLPTREPACVLRTGGGREGAVAQRAQQLPRPVGLGLGPQAIEHAQRCSGFRGGLGTGRSLGPGR